MRVLVAEDVFQIVEEIVKFIKFYAVEAKYSFDSPQYDALGSYFDTFISPSFSGIIIV